MTWHPSAEQLAAFLDGKLPRAEMPGLLAHLARECPACMERLVRLMEGSAGEEDEGEPAAIPPELDAAYAQALDKAFARVRRAVGALEKERAAAAAALAGTRDEGEAEDLLLGDDGRLGPWVKVEKLIEQSYGLRFRDPWRMLLLARFAQIGADNLSLARYPERPVRDLQALAWAGLANAHRVADDLAPAREAMAVAVARCKEGTGNPLLLARILALTASLRCDERRLSEALTLLDGAYGLYAAYGERHLAGHALISKAVHTVDLGQYEQALLLLRQGLALADPERDPQLVLCAVHAMADALARSGRFHEARRLIWRAGLRTLMAGDRLSQLKLQWLEARIDAGLGRLERAEAALSEVREAFGREGLPYKQAITSLDLATVRLRLGKAEEVAPLVEEMVVVFSALGIRREALTALRMRS